jgi:hypothetical protein
MTEVGVRELSIEQFMFCCRARLYNSLYMLFKSPKVRNQILKRKTGKKSNGACTNRNVVTGTTSLVLDEIGCGGLGTTMTTWITNDGQGRSLRKGRESGSSHWHWNVRRSSNDTSVDERCSLVSLKIVQ